MEVEVVDQPWQVSVTRFWVRHSVVNWCALTEDTSCSQAVGQSGVRGEGLEEGTDGRSQLQLNMLQKNGSFHDSPFY